MSFPRGLMFHRFRAEGANSLMQGALSAAELEGVIRQAGVQNILSPREWIERSTNGTLAPTHRCITFDDGLRSQIDIALPVLERHGLKAFWFLYTCIWQGQPVKSEVYSFAAARLGGMDFLVEKFMEKCPAALSHQLSGQDFIEYKNSIRKVAPFYSDNDIRYRFLRNRTENRQLFEKLMDELLSEAGCSAAKIADHLWLEPADAQKLANNGHVIGLHSHAHPYEISKLSENEQTAQYRQNYDLILQATGQKPVSVAHPLNSYGESTLQILRSLGIVCGFRANMLPPAGKKINPGPLEWAREDSASLVLSNRSMSI